MRRSSYTPLMTQISGEPLIVVEESGNTDDEGDRTGSSSPRQSPEMESPTHNPYLLSPWRDPKESRKHSLPTPQCSGITASQVRRLSERGGEGSGPSPREAAFLATLSSVPGPAAGGRRHSVVTISKVPPALFGRNRRESIAAVPSSIRLSSKSILANRRESLSSITGPPSTEHRGSIHNLQLDIMDDIVTARKVRMKMWNTSNERVCEVQPLDVAEGGASSPMRYTQGKADAPSRRYSDFIGTTLPVIPSGGRRASEYAPAAGGSSDRLAAGIVCTNTDLISILSSLTSSSTEINMCGVGSKQESSSKATTLEQKRSKLKNSRSNSFDVSILHGTKLPQSLSKTPATSTSNWFVKRHQPMSTKKGMEAPAPTVGAFKAERKDCKEKKANKVVWDGKSGSVVDAQLIGSAIEVFLRRAGTPESPTPASPTNSSPSKGAVQKVVIGSSPKTQAIAKPNSGNWFPTKQGDEESADACDSSLCSTLKDLFVK